MERCQKCVRFVNRDSPIERSCAIRPIMRGVDSSKSKSTESGSLTLKRRFFWILVAVLMLPLGVILIVQYRSLHTLEQALPVYRKELMDRYLEAVTAEVQEFYNDGAEKALAVPADAIAFTRGGSTQDHWRRSWVHGAFDSVADHFNRQEFHGARRFFISVIPGYEGAGRDAVLFYDPARQSMEFDPHAPEMRAINVACAPYMIYIRARAIIVPQAMGISRDPNHPLMVKPIIDAENRIQGIAGLVLDQEWFKDEVAPKMVDKLLPRFFPGEYHNAAVTLRFSGQMIYATQQADDLEPESTVHFSQGFWNYTLGIRMNHLSVEQWARRSFIVNLSLSVAMALVLSIGLLLGLRAASREMKLLQMKADFVANVSHELRTPLASIRVFAEMLKLGRVSQPEKVRDYGSYIETQGRRLTQLINNILDFSRIESGKKNYQCSLTDLREVVSESLEICAGRLGQSGLRINVEGAGPPPPPVLIDSGAMVLALTNLLDNAIKYSGGAGEIVLRLGREDGFAFLSVRDDGIGIPLEEQGKIFEKFYRVSTGMVHDVKGTGLGLSLVKHITEAHRGTVMVESGLGLGSTFTIRLPIDGLLDPALGDPSSRTSDEDGALGYQSPAGFQSRS